MGSTNTLLRSLKLHGRIEYFLLLTGANLALLSFIMLRHVTIAFRQTDIALGVFSVAVFVGISLGYGISDRISLVTIRRAIPVILIVQMAMILLIPSFYHVLSRDVGAWARQHELSDAAGEWVATAAVFLLVTVGVSAPYSVFLPLIIQSQEKNLRRYVSITLSGAIGGLLLVAVLGFFAHIWLLSGYFATFIAVSLALGANRRVTLGLLTLIAVFLVNFGTWDKASAAWLYERRFGPEIQGVAHTRYTPYHKIEVLELDSGKQTIALDGQLQLTEGPDSSHHYFLAEYPALRFDRPKVCALGGAAMSSIHRIGEHASSIQIVDLDAAVLETDRSVLARPGGGSTPALGSFVVDDPKHFLASTDDRFDLILHCLPPARSRLLALMYTAEFFASAKARLTPSGIFSTACPSLFDSRSSYGKTLLATLVHVFERHVVLAHGDSAYFYGGLGSLNSGEEESFRNVLESSGDVEIRVLQQSEIDELIKDATVITINKVGDLIYE